MNVVRWAIVALAFTLGFAPRALQADSLGVGAPPQFSIRIQPASPDLSVAVHTWDRLQLTECRQLCTLVLTEGHYRVRIFGPDGYFLVERRVHARHTAIWNVLPPNPKARDLGLILGIAGIPVFLGGAVLASSAFMPRTRPLSTTQGLALAGGFLLAGAGAVANTDWLGASRPKLATAPPSAKLAADV